MRHRGVDLHRLSLLTHLDFLFDLGFVVDGHGLVTVLTGALCVALEAVLGLDINASVFLDDLAVLVVEPVVSRLLLLATLVAVAGLSDKTLVLVLVVVDETLHLKVAVVEPWLVSVKKDRIQAEKMFDIFVEFVLKLSQYRWVNLPLSRSPQNRLLRFHRACRASLVRIPERKSCLGQN